MDSDAVIALESASVETEFMSFLSDKQASLPPEILLKVFQFLDSDLDICRCAQVSRHWHDVAEDPTLREVLTIDTDGSASQLNNSDSNSQNSPGDSNGSPASLPDLPVGDIEESLAMLPKRCSRLVSLEMRQVPPNCIDGLLASFISDCPELHDLTLSFLYPPLRNFAICQLALSSRIRSLTIDAALLCNENAYEQLSGCQYIEAMTFTASGNYNSHQFMLGLQIFFSECSSPLAKITLPEYAPLSSNTLSINLVQLICSRFEHSLVTLNMWPVRSTNQVVESLCRIENLTNLSLFEVKFTRFSPALWKDLNRKLNECEIVQISHSALTKQIVDLFSEEIYYQIRELICISCEFDDDQSLTSFLKKFRAAVNLEFHLHYGLSMKVLTEICEKFTRIEHLTLSDLSVPDTLEQRSEFMRIFEDNNMIHLKQLNLSFIRKEEDSQMIMGTEDSFGEVEELRSSLQKILSGDCELSIELDAI